MDPATVKGNRQALPTMSPAPVRSCPRSRPCSLSVCWGTRLTADPMSSRALCCACPCQPGGRHGPGGTHADGGAVSQQSVTGATPSAQLVSLLAPDTAAFLTVFSLLVQHCQQEAASTQLVPVSAVVSVHADGCEDQLGVLPCGQPPGLI